ncbi:MAG: RNA polymerase sigma factor RpoD/SigA [Treponema sp.]|nr:RNA polymerase sigma factor RpoD/SigA [Treponema sp.]
MKTKKNKTGSAGRPNNAEENTLLLYLKEINKIPLLKKDEEEQFAKLAAKGDLKARDKLINSNLRFVVSIAKQHQGKGLPMEDLISEGNLGLMHAAKQFDVDKGYRFITYAVWWIRQSIMKAIFEKSRIIRLPGNKLVELNRIDRTRQIISGRVGINSSDEIREISEFLDFSQKKTNELMKIRRDVLSMDEPVIPSENAAVIRDFIEDESGKGPVELAINSVLRDELREEVAKLDERDAELIRCRYGLEGKYPMSLKEIGASHNLSRERVRQIEKRALKQLRQSAKSELLRSFIA